MKPRTACLIRTGVIATGTWLAATAWAGISPDGLKALDSTLTPMGAQRAASGDGNVPAWSGKWLGAPPTVKYQPGDRYPDPYADEKPLFVISAQNMAQYATNLTDGQKAMLKKYPDTFRIPVYPSHRDFRYDDGTYKAIRTYAAGVEMIGDGNGLKNAGPTVPFPVPKTGLELLWNLKYASSIDTEKAVYDQAVVYPEGNIAWGKVKYDIWSPKDARPFDPKLSNLNRAYFRVATDLPLNERGTIMVGYSVYDSPDASSNRTWMYSPGTRRVRQAPEYGYDQPQGPGGFRTVDDDHFFNGSPERYQWKIAGKREIYVPYDNYRMLSSSLKYSDLLTPHHADPARMRYELHRVWVLEATLKPGFRHQYAKRVIYLDEDSWYGLLSDNFDSRGALWRTNIQTNVYAYDAQRFYPTAVFYHDLVSGAYMADRLTNAGPMTVLNRNPSFNEAYFAPDAARGSGL
ncbi:DUF1329 domain-containing protein [Burkholderia pseudomultivorans]|uniref:DUF1329 domain-containing protein n=1 Tax=Burkholderia pseudomultivorans TaxID=1207504 RepID=A0ABU2E8E8_9BURK|nr:DUF1329 domain-containing protein [Burkholderia pseudomultivorans]MDR8729952.1 hypothetical protein [Burkholderia pseudomultivorans]MDR8735794.1 hypothetical protein [Burkholderia pseudomultivorans]MDR8744392.1 hypothetical protein [Burkholderia pseudomultivorans]MDR8756150.1 hypothetical protein [Burkholderia pseudomultivorans]MDR8780949.1 hypothetical protein [Burkholderia pseudomultivorans]